MSVELKPRWESDPVSIPVWVDTGFTGELVLPRTIIDQLHLDQSGSVDAILADGSRVELPTFSCLISWFSRWQPLEIIANEGEFPLLGVGMLLGCELRINYDSLHIELYSEITKHDSPT